MPEEEFKLLLHCSQLVEAHHCANLLLAAGVRAEVRNTFLSGALGDIPFLEAGPQVWIDARQNPDTAKEIIAAAQKPPTRTDWICECCRETVEGQFAQCWRCGTVRPSGEEAHC